MLSSSLPITGPDPAARSARPLAPQGAIACAMVALAALIAFRGSVGYFFCQDDTVGLAIARGVSSPDSSIWRYVSHVLFYRWMHGALGLNAWAFHAVMLSFHAGSSVLVYVLLRRTVSTPAALVGASLFATHPAAFRATYWISAGADVLATFFALAAWWLTSTRSPLRAGSIVLFGVSLLCKESTLLLPLVVWADVAARRKKRPAAGGGPPYRTVCALGVVALGFLAALLLPGVFADGPALPRGNPYAAGVGGHVVHNLLTYAGWAVNLPFLQLRNGNDVVYHDAYVPYLTPLGVAAVALYLAGFLSERLRARGWGLAGVTYLAFLLPVLPLEHHAFRYYLYAPLVGIAMCCAAIADLACAERAREPRLASRRQRRRASASSPRARRRSWSTTLGIAGACALVLLVNAVVFVHRMESWNMGGAPLRADHTIRRSLLARGAYEALREAHVPRGSSVVLYSPVASEFERARRRLPRGAPIPLTVWEENMESALGGSVGLRGLLPHLGAIRFAHTLDGTSNDDVFAVYAINGETRIMNRRALVDEMRRAGLLAADGE